MVREIVVITGLPGSGKSTLAEGLAASLPEFGLLSMGAEIRSERIEGTRWDNRLESAYAGDCTFDVNFITSVFERALSRRTPEQALIVDGGVGIERALQRTGTVPLLSIHLVAPRVVRIERMERRALTGSRDDDLPEIIRRRTDTQSRAVRDLVSALSRMAPSISLDGTVPPRSLLRAALSGVLLARGGSESHSRSAVLEGSLEGVAEGPVMLVKPHLNISRAHLRHVRDLLLTRGWGVKWIEEHPTGTPATADKARAHFDEHFLYSAFASTLLGKGYVGGLEAHSQWVERAWSTDVICKTGDGYWRTPVMDDGRVLVNGHMRDQLYAYEAPGGTVIAIGLHPVDPVRASWRELRDNVLGASNPADAPPASLRGKGARGFFSDEPFTLQANGFHMSAGPLEALRESILWSRRPLNVDWRFAVAQDVVGLGTSFAATAGHDWSSPTVSGVVESMKGLQDR
jgi:adenylate kinase family enzyme